MRKLSFTAIAALLLSCQGLAQAPVEGVDDPESLFTDEDPQLHRNKQAALHIMRDLLQCNRWDEADKWITDRYIQHNPNVQSGLQPVVEFFTATTEPAEECDELTTPIVAVLAEDDLVTVAIAREYPHPARSGETYSTTWFDMWRFVDGKADEHWDPATLPSGN